MRFLTALAASLIAAAILAGPAQAQRPHVSLADAVENSRGFWSWETQGQAVQSTIGLRCMQQAGRFALSELSFKYEVTGGGAYCHYAGDGGAHLFVLISPPRWQPADEARARRRIGTEAGSLLEAKTEGHAIGACSGVRNDFRWETEMETTLLLLAEEHIVSVTLFTPRAPDPNDITFLDQAALASGGC